MPNFIETIGFTAQIEKNSTRGRTVSLTGTPKVTGVYTGKVEIIDHVGLRGEVELTIKVRRSSTGGGSSSSTADICPDGDKSGSTTDGKCEATTLATGSVNPDTAKETPISQEDTPDANVAITTAEGKLKYVDTVIYNSTIENGMCYTRREYLGILDSLKIVTSEEFKKALSFLRSYEMTMFDGVEGFDPHRSLSREEAAKIFSQFAMNVLCRKPDLSLQVNYSDTESANPTLKPYITLAYQLGVMKGSGMGDGAFRPFDFISKAEVNAVLMRMILKSYLNENQSVWYADYNLAATALGIITQGAGEGVVPRNDVALMLFRAYKNQAFDWRNLDYYSYVLQNRDLFVK